MERSGTHGKGEIKFEMSYEDWNNERLQIKNNRREPEKQS